MCGLFRCPRTSSRKSASRSKSTRKSFYNRPNANATDKRGRFQYPFWRAKYLTEAAAPGATTHVLFSQGKPLFQHLESHLLAAGHDVLDVRPGEEYTVTNRNTITINPLVNEHEEHIYQPHSEQQDGLAEHSV